MVQLDRQQRGVAFGMTAGLVVSLMTVLFGSSAFVKIGAPERADIALLLPATTMFVAIARMAKHRVLYARRYRWGSAWRRHATRQDLAITSAKYTGAAGSGSSCLYCGFIQSAQRDPGCCAGMRLLVLFGEASVFRHIRTRRQCSLTWICAHVLPNSTAAHLAIRATLDPNRRLSSY